MKQIIFTLLLVFCFWLLQGQTQTVKGIVSDKQAETPLIGAAIEWLGSGGTVSAGTTTDADGSFRLENIPVGRHNFRVSYLGYLTLTLPNVVVTSGKEVMLIVSLEESVEELSEVVVTSTVDKDKAQNDMAAISARQFSLEEVNRFSGGRSDVARLVGNFAGVSTSDDSRNDIVIRGNSPTGVLWRLEGIPIPNPNHFSTLGTTGGPVSALNPNLLRNSDFLTSAFPAEYGNALAGVFDLGFRSGNRDEREYTIQMGAVSGIEAMAEGPVGKEGAFILAGRYSFVGIAGDLGLPIGTNASPDYQDLAFKIDFGAGKSKFSVFGVGGRSDITFLHDEVDESDLFAAADEDSGAKSKFGVLGVRHNWLLDDKTYLRTIIGVSTSQNDFYRERILNMNTEEEKNLRIFENDNKEYRLTFSSFLNKKFNARFSGRAGLLLEQSYFDLRLDDRENRPDLDGNGEPDWVRLYGFKDNTTMVQPFAQAQYKFSDQWVLNAGIHAQYLALNEDVAVEPRLALSWKFSAAQSLTLGYGLHQQSQPLPILLLKQEVRPGVFMETNHNLEFTRSDHLVLGYDVRVAKDWRGKAELYYQNIKNVPVEPYPGSFSMLNVGADFGFPSDKVSLVNEGTGKNYGLEITLEKFFSKGYYALFTSSIYQSKYKGSDGIERHTAFNNEYVVNVLFGKEWKTGEEKRNAFTFDTKFTTAGGRPYTPVDLAASREKGEEVRKQNEAFSLRNENYLRWDVKFGFQKNSKTRKFSQQFFIDIQNVLNRDNLFAKRYNRLTNEVNDVYQIGLFPDFMYRIQF